MRITYLKADLSLSLKLTEAYLNRKRAVRVATEQVNDWGLGCIDLYLIHFPVALDYNPENTRVSWWHNIFAFRC
jgi:D-xylose reductase